MTYDLAGAWDFYCHTRPCLLPRWGSAIDVASAAQARGMAGLVLQTHHESTHSRAVTAAQAVPGIAVIGGITLNRYVGGPNRLTVRAALRAGARVVWLPTVHGTGHVRTVGAGRSLSGVIDATDNAPGLALAKDGAPTPAMLHVLDEIEEHGAILCSGHASLDEIDALLPHAHARRIPFVVSHPYFVIRPPGAWWRDLPSDGVYAQLAAITESGHLLPTIDEALSVIDCIGPARCVVGSEMQRQDPVMAIETYARALATAGIVADDLHELLVTTPLRVLGQVLEELEVL